jgi:hypothetical protein
MNKSSGHWGIRGIVSLVAAVAIALAIPIFALAAYTTSQIGFDDDRGITNSVKVDCPAPYSVCHNQSGGFGFSQCFPTPNRFTHLYDWWWVGAPIIRQYTSSNCSGTQLNANTLNIGGSNPHPWDCFNYPQQQTAWQC